MPFKYKPSASSVKPPPIDESGNAFGGGMQCNYSSDFMKDSANGAGPKTLCPLPIPMQRPRSLQAISELKRESLWSLSMSLMKQSSF